MTQPLPREFIHWGTLQVRINETGQANKSETIPFSAINWSEISSLDHAGPANASLSCCNWCLKTTFYRKFRHEKGFVCSKACPCFANASTALKDVTSPYQLCLTYSHRYLLKYNWPKLPSQHLEAHCTFSPKLRKSLLLISTHFVPAVLVWNMLLQALFTAEQLCALLTFK